MAQLKVDNSNSEKQTGTLFDMTNVPDLPIRNRKLVKPTFSNTWEAAKTAFELIASHRTPADPLSYAVWYAYAAKTDPDLVAAVDAILAQGSTINAAEMKQLHAEYVQSRSETEGELEHISRAIQDEVAGAKSLVTDIISNTDEYVASIDKTKDMLPADASEDDLKIAIDGILQQGQASKASAQDLQVSLQRRHDEISLLSSKVLKLRDDLAKDALTELVNRAKFEEVLTERYDEAITNGYSLTVMVLHIKNVHGLCQEAGSDISEFIMKSFSDIARRTIGDKGLCARFSGPEFAIMLPRHAYADAGKLANALIDELEMFKIVKKQSGQFVGYVECAIGGASVRAGWTPSDLIAAASEQARQVKSLDRSSVKFDLSRPTAA